MKNTINYDTIYTLVLISAIIAPIISSIVTTLINNIFQIFMRKNEIKHEEAMRIMEINRTVSEKRIDFAISSKYDIFNKFIEDLSLRLADLGSKEQQMNLYASSCKVASLCSDENNRAIIMNFVNSIPKIYGQSNFDEFEHQLNAVSKVFQTEFSMDFTFQIKNMLSSSYKRSS